MSPQSNFGRLFRNRALSGQEPIENYTSEALAIAIEHDDGPMRRALGSIVWSKSPPFDPHEVKRIEPRTQCYLSKVDTVRCGYLDMVLRLTFADGAVATAWVEVKVDTGEHGGQLDVYAEHASRELSRPFIFTLSKYEVRPVERHPANVDIGWLSWKDLAAAIEQSPDSDDRWDDLLSFLNEEGIAWRSMPTQGPDPVAHLKVLEEVNQQIRARWPNATMDFGRPRDLRTVALSHLKYSARLIATGGPLTYGLVPSKQVWNWWISVGSENNQRVRLDSAEIVRQADDAGLSDRWQRAGLRSATLALQVPLTEFAKHEDAVAWFSAALDELKAKDVLNTFLEGLKAKAKTGGTQSNGSESPR